MEYFCILLFEKLRMIHSADSRHNEWLIIDKPCHKLNTCNPIYKEEKNQKTFLR